MAGEIAENVRAFIDRAAALVGEVERSRWAEDGFTELLEAGTQSPIEDLFYLAVKALAVASYNRLNPDPRHDSTGAIFYPGGIYLTPQHKAGKYRVDFLVTQVGISPEDGPVAVELDGHAFHDKDKHQRAYEKRRDRDLVRAGYKVMHFTGSEVVADPFRVAYEVLEMLGVFEGVREAYDPADPMGMEIR